MIDETNTPVTAPILSDPIELDTPIKRGDQTIGFIQIRRPNGAGELRGLNLVEVGQLHVDSIIKLLPRITVPRIEVSEASALSVADLLACGAEIASFLLRKRDRPEGSHNA